MSRTLDRKLLRDLRTLRGPVAAIALVLAAGVAAFVCTVTAYHGLRGSRDAYYARYGMPDVFAPVKKAPLAITEELGRVPGVRRARGRIVFDVTMDVAGAREPVSGRIISMPDRHRDVLADIHLVRGRWFEGDGTRQAIVGQRFAEVRELDIGDRVSVVMNDRKESLTIVGLATSPEYVYMVRGGAEILPDPANFTVLWCSRSYVESAFDFEGSVNDVLATLDRGASEQDVIDAFDERLDRYGAIGAFGKGDQLSNRVLRDDINGLRGTATVLPVVFLGVAGFILHMVMHRLTQSQRTQISVLRAFGYRTREIAVHYLEMALAIGLLGAGVGTALGLWLADGVLAMYLDFYSLPIARLPLVTSTVFTAVGVTLACTIFGAASAVRSVAKLRPAEGLRPAAPQIFHHGLLESWTALWKRLGFAGRMILRHVTRTPMRSITTIAGIALATGLMLTTFYLQQAMDVLIELQFTHVERHDLRISFHDENGLGALREVAALPGVRTAEPEGGVAVRLVNGWREERTAIIGVAAGQTMHGLLDSELRNVPVPTEGLVMSRQLAESLALRPGERVEAHVLTGERQRLTPKLTAVVDDYFGVAAYAEIDELSRWLGEETVVSGALLRVDPERRDELSRELLDLPSVASVVSRENTVRSFTDTLAQSQDIMNAVMIAFAGTIAFGVLYNAARIALAEKQRLLASLRVLGFRRREVAAVLTGENALLALLGIPPGLAIGAGLAYLIVTVNTNDMIRFPFVISARAVIQTVLCVAVFGLIANISVWRRVARLDVVSALKGGE